MKDNEDKEGVKKKDWYQLWRSWTDEVHQSDRFGDWDINALRLGLGW